MIRFVIFSCCLILVSGCADLRSAQRDFNNQNYQHAQQQWQALADKGFGEAELQLAALYSAGHLGDDNVSKAIGHYNRAVQLGYTKAFSGLGRFLLKHSGDSQQKAIAVKLIIDAANQDIAAAQFALAELQLTGSLVEQDIPAAIKTLQKISQQGSANAAYKLARLFEDGVAVNQDYNTAWGYLQTAQELGYPAAQLRAARYYEFGLGTEVDLSKAESILQQLVAMGSVPAIYQLAAFKERIAGEPTKESITLLDRAVLGNYVPAKLRMADLYLRGEGVPIDPERAIAIYQTYSSEGMGSATARLGDLFRDGEHRPLDYSRAYQFYQLAWQQDFDRAELRMAKLTGLGLGVPQDINAAKIIYHRFALRGDAAGSFGYAQMLELEAKGQPFPPAAVNWYKSAAAVKYRPAQLRYADVLLNGLGMNADITSGLNLLNDMNDEGVAKAATELGDLYREGLLVESNHRDSEKYYIRAVELGSAPANLRLAELYSSGNEEVQDRAKAKAIFLQQSQLGNVEATYKLARLLEQRMGKGSITPAIIKLYQQASEQGYPPARLRFADLQLNGVGVSQNPQQAILTYRELSESEVGAATFRVGKLHEYGTLTAINYNQAFKYYQLASQQGYPLAQMQIAKFYFEGKSVKQNVAKAKQLYTRLSEAHYAKADFMLGEMYRLLAQSISADWLQLAIKWYRRSAAQGYQDANYQLALLLDKQTGKQSSAGSQLLLVAAKAGHGKAMMAYGLRRFHGYGCAANQIEGLAFSVSAARVQTTGALKQVLTLIEQISAVNVVAAAIEMSDQMNQSAILLDEVVQDAST